MQATFTPLLGGGVDDPLCGLLRLGDCGILLDCGWSHSFDVSQLEPVLRHLPEVDAVLLSHPDIAHLGALPYLCGKGRLTCPVFATRPVVKMGTMCLYDTLQAHMGTCDFEGFQEEDIDRAFDRVTQLKYHQTIPLSGRCEGITITAHPAGHLVGGSAWSVRVGAEEVVYAVAFNHQAERHLNAPTLDSAFSRPAALITDAAARQDAPSEQRRRREEALCEALLGVLRAGGCCLLPVDTAGRVLELLLVLDAYWGEHRLAYPLVLMSSVAQSTLKFARTQLEYMSDAVNTAFMLHRDNPFTCKRLVLAGAPSDLEQLPQGPKVVLATGSDLEAGLARALLLQWSSDPRNAVLLTQRPGGGTLAAQLLAMQAAGPGRAHALPVRVFRRVPLEGAELEEHLRRKAEEEAAHEAAAAAEAEEAPAALPLRASSGAISKLVVGAKGAVVQVLGGAFANEAAALADAHEAEGTLVDGFTIPAGAVHAMFPDEDAHLYAVWDSYGEAIDAATFTGAGAGGEGGALGAMEVDEGEEEAAAASDVPTKVVTELATLHMAAHVLRFAFDGLTDFSSAANILTRIAPRALLLLAAGSPAEAAPAVARLASPATLGRYGTALTVAEPQQPHALALSATRELGLSAALLAGLQLRPVAAQDEERYRVAWVDGLVELEEEGGEAATAQQQEGGAQASGDAAAGAAAANGAGSAADAKVATDARETAPSQPRLQLLPAVAGDVGAATEAADAAADGDDAGGARHGGIFIGNVQLSALKQELARSGLASEFRVVDGERCLLVAGGVLVRRAPGGDEGALVLEGPLSEEYWRIRDVMYGQFSIA